MVNTIDGFSKICVDNVNLDLFSNVSKTKMYKTVKFMVVECLGLNSYCSLIRIEFSDDWMSSKMNDLNNLVKWFNTVISL